MCLLKAKWLLCAPPGFTFKQYYVPPRERIYMCLVWYRRQCEIIFLHRIKEFVFYNGKGVCSPRGTNWIFNTVQVNSICNVLMLKYAVIFHLLSKKSHLRPKYVGTTLVNKWQMDVCLLYSDCEWLYIVIHCHIFWTRYGINTLQKERI